MSELVEIGSIAAVRQGRYTAPGEMSERPSPSTMFPVWGANGILGYTSNATYEEAQPLVTCRGNGCGLVQWSAGRAHVSNNAMAIVLTNADPLSSKYLYYSLLASDFSDVITGSAQPQITMGHLTKKKIFWHKERHERTAIAHILGTLDDKIELNRKTNETLEAIAKAIFKSWFVDFDPVRAKAAGRSTGLPAEISDLFPDSFEDSELGEIPRGWSIELLGDLIELAYGKPLKEEDRIPGRYHVYGSNGIVGSHIEAFVRAPGIVVGRKGNPGTVNWAEDDFFPIDTTFYVIPRKESVSMRFLYFSLENQALPSISADSAVPGLNRNLAYTNKQIVPGADIIAVFERISTSLFERKSIGVKEAQVLEHLRNSLLPKLISGELRIHDAEALVAEAGL